MTKMQNRIFSVDDGKALKAQDYGYINAIHYMAPARLAGVGNLCAGSTISCRKNCLGWESGHAGIVANDADINATRASRIAKARRFMRTRKEYMVDVVRSVELLEKRIAKAGRRARNGRFKRRSKLCIRLNGSTDVPWEGVACVRNGVTYRNIMAAFPHIVFVDYTKIASRLTRDLPANYYLTLSRHEDNDAAVLDAVRAGHNAAVVFAGGLPATWHGLRVIDGDAHDLRHLDPRGVIVGLSPKGRKAQHDMSGFVVRNAIAA